MSLLVWSRQILPVCPRGRGRLLVTAVSPGVMWGHTVSWRVWSLLLVDFIRQLSQDSLYFCRAEADWQRSRQRCVIGSVGGKAPLWRGLTWREDRGGEDWSLDLQQLLLLQLKEVLEHEVLRRELEREEKTHAGRSFILQLGFQSLWW